MKSHLARRVAVLIALVLVTTLGWSPGVASANTTGTSVFTVGANEGVTYARMIRLAHAGAATGRLLATFEYGVASGTAHLPIRQSLDNGATWTTLSTVVDGMTGAGHPSSTFYQPFLYELPQQVGAYPAGTLLLTANVIGTDNSTNFELWRSADRGATWTYVSMYQYARNADVGGDDPGIWEPFLTVNGDGKLAMFFADERQRSLHSQFVGHIVSNDGGDTWSAKPDGSLNYAPGLVKDVATPAQVQRPGMPTVTKLPNGTYVLGYEICSTARNACEAYLKKSTNGGATWGTGPADPGTFVQTTDGRYLGSSPYVVWSPGGGPNGQLLMAGMHVRYTSGNAFTEENHEGVFVNTNNGDGAWSWFPAPLQIGNGGIGSLSNYSPSLLPSADGTEVRYTAPSDLAGQPRSERTASANAGVLPYAAPWSAGLQNGWKHYGGTWSLSGGALSASNGLGFKSIAGSTGWTNYVLEGDVRMNSIGPNGNAGLVFRVSDPDIGTDALNGYYVGVAAGNVILGRMNYDWAQLPPSAAIPGGAPAGAWIHLRVKVTGCTIEISAKRVDDPNPAPTIAPYTDASCHAFGQVGLRTFDATASWRNLTVTAV